MNCYDELWKINVTDKKNSQNILNQIVHHFSPTLILDLQYNVVRISWQFYYIDANLSICLCVVTQNVPWFFFEKSVNWHNVTLNRRYELFLRVDFSNITFTESLLKKYYNCIWNKATQLQLYISTYYIR